MPQGISGRALAKLVGVSDTAIRKAVKAGRLKVYADGSFDETASIAAWQKTADPARTAGRELANRTREPANPAVRATVRTEDDAVDAVALIRRVLQAEGVADGGAIDYGAARTADTILKAHQRDLQMRIRRKELVELEKVKAQAARGFVGIKQAAQRLPSRFAAQIAAEVECDAAQLDGALGRMVATFLDELSAPVVRA